MDESDAFSYIFLKGWYEKQRRRNMKFAQLNGVQISEDQVKDLQEQIDRQKKNRRAIGVDPVLKTFDCIVDYEINVKWEAVDTRDCDGSFKLYDRSSDDPERWVWMTRGSCEDLISFLRDCIKDIDNGVLE